MKHPYHDLPAERYWRTGVADVGGFGLTDLWQPKFHMGSSTCFITAGSCFAQHISKRMVARGYRWLDAEPGPDLDAPIAKRRHNYGIFSFRTGNIYTARMLLQWVGFAFGEVEPALKPLERDGRFYDPYRQQIEPEGFSDVSALDAARQATFTAVRKAFTEADVLLFTFGLTEAWQDIETDQEYSSCPGVVAGEFDPVKTRLVNHSVGEVLRDFRMALRIINKHRKKNIRVVTTVSPVPLTATASPRHVLVATTYSKSVLRAAAGALSDHSPSIDYFPSYEIVTAPISRGMHYEGNSRNVTGAGVDAVLSHFFQALAPLEQQGATPSVADDSAFQDPADPQTGDVICEEVILDAFASR